MIFYEGEKENGSLVSNIFILPFKEHISEQAKILAPHSVF